MKIYGYSRISRNKQNIERQVRNIKAAYPSATIIKEAFTGTSINRPEWNKLYKLLKQGDTVVFDSVSRMSRNAEEGFSLYEELFNNNINLVFLKEPHINTETYRNALNGQISLTGEKIDCILSGVNQYLMLLAKEQIRLAFIQAEKEVLDLHQRTKEGIETARLNGKQIGQRRGVKLNTKKSIQSKKLIERYCKDFGGSLTDADCIKLIGISKNTYYKYKKDIAKT